MATITLCETKLLIKLRLKLYAYNKIQTMLKSKIIAFYFNYKTYKGAYIFS